jgi:hypothetical protein
VIRSAGEIRVDVTLPTALQLVDAVHRADRIAIAELLGDADLPALAVVLAAMVDDSRTLSELLSWTSDLRVRPIGSPRGRHTSALLQPCGTHAAFVRHTKRQEPVDEACRIAERTYQRNRVRSRAPRSVA